MRMSNPSVKKAAAHGFFLLISLIILNLCCSKDGNKQRITLADDEVIVSELVSVYDGDTFKINIKGYPAVFGKNILVRISRIDTPEMKDPRPEIKALARRARELAEKKLREAKVILLRKMRRDKYFRINAEVYVDGQNLGQIMLDAGLARPYDGESKVEWELDKNAK